MFVLKRQYGVPSSYHIVALSCVVVLKTIRRKTLSGLSVSRRTGLKSTQTNRNVFSCRDRHYLFFLVPFLKCNYGLFSTWTLFSYVFVTNQ
ncbi:hypothetical protein FQN60_001604 [Etheostoma spectabile]|uniref:Uncharacterized protein n=1 Tax=Etheostoma spectabile TaxID=54343 RepID=A0A5J5D636_9PERO|nr:hypothetical protein FQN60_001604 [Etheostoma spectabile]